MSGRERSIMVAGLISAVVCISICILFGSADGTPSSDRKAIILISTTDPDIDEEGKAQSFYGYLLDEGYSEDDISFLGFEETEGSDGTANISNINQAFEDLIAFEDPLDEVIIYISDHEQGVLGNSSFVFIDGSITADTISLWMDSIDYTEATMILNGNRSGLAGPELQDPDRVVISSMDWDQTSDQDLFNITRGLTDQTADINFDGVVSYYEAYMKECFTLRFEDQNPQYYFE